MSSCQAATTHVQEESFEKCSFPRVGGRVTAPDRPDGSTREGRDPGRGKGRAGGGGGVAEKRTTRWRRRNAVRSHIGSDTSNPEATPQIPPSCWTSCSLHNRIRMNRPSPTRPRSSASPSRQCPPPPPLSPTCLLVYSLLAPRTPRSSPASLPSASSLLSLPSSPRPSSFSECSPLDFSSR